MGQTDYMRERISEREHSDHEDQPAASALIKPRGLSLRKNIGWALLGNVIYQGSQWLVLVLLAKLLTVADVGRFALALAICTPITAFSALNLRAVQVTDVQNTYRFGHFLAVQLVMSLLSVVVIAIIGFYGAYDTETALIIAVIGVGQAILVVRDVFLASSQKQERMDAVAFSKAMMGLLSLGTLAVAVWSTESLLVAVIGMQSAKLAIFLLWDLPATHRMMGRGSDGEPVSFRPAWDLHAMRRLARVALPLGSGAVLLSLFTSGPRYLIEFTMGTRDLGYFAAIMALVMAGGLIVQAVAQSALPRLSRYYEVDRIAFNRLVLRLCCLGAFVGAVGLTAVMFFGPTILMLAFTRDYAAYHDLFLWSMSFGTLSFIGTFLMYGVIASRRFRLHLAAAAGAFATTAISGVVLISQFGLVGAVWCLMAGKTVHIALNAWTLWGARQTVRQSVEVR